MGMIIVIIAIVLWFSHKKTGFVGGPTPGSGFRLPEWLFKSIGIFLLIMLILNVSDVVLFVKAESSNWWPIVKESGHTFSKWLREIIGSAAEGGK